jgi:cation diffusion facilitator family transporter
LLTSATSNAIRRQTLTRGGVYKHKKAQMAASSHNSTARAILYAFIANFGIAIAKTWAAWLTGSGSMLAEAIHSYADTGNQVLLYLGLRQAQRPPDNEHPLGYGKLSYFWSFIVALMLFSLGGLFSIYEGMHKLSDPQDLSQLWVALLVLGLAIVLEGASLLGCLREIKLIRGERPFREWIKHTRNSALVVVLGEDIGALVGLILAFGFLVVASITGNPVYDAFGSICIGVVLLVISAFIAMRVRSLLVGRSADPEIVELINDVIAGQDGIDAVFNVITIQFGPDTMLAAKIKMTPGTSIEAAVRNINALERTLKERIPTLTWCFVEPDVAD